MLIRSAIAAIDFNSNIGRAAKMTSDGLPRFQKKVSGGMLILTIAMLQGSGSFSIMRFIRKQAWEAISSGIV